MAGEVNSIGDAFQWSISQIARAFGMDRKTVSRRLEDAGVAPAGKKGGYATYALKDAGPALFAQTTVPGFVFDPESMMPKDRKDWYQSENERLKFEREMQKLVEAHEVRRELSQMAKAVANTMDAIPDLLERDCGLDPDSLDRVQVSLDGLRESMYRAIVGDEESDEEEAS